MKNKFLIKLIIPIYKIYCDIKWNIKWKNYLKTNDKLNLIVGAANTDYQGWFPTDIQINDGSQIQINVFDFDITKEEHFISKLNNRKINKVLAEHVLEHLTLEQIEKMLENFSKYAEKDINIRIAVPDGYHNNQEYIEMVKPGGHGEGAHDHKHLFNYQSLSKIFENYGFKAEFIEYWDENQQFHTIYNNDDKGYIKRSALNDKRNIKDKPFYTSLIIDFTKI